MKRKIVASPSLALTVLSGVLCASNLHAQSAPTITTQPASQTNSPGSIVTLSVAVDGTGPFTYQWRFNGTNIPNNIISTVAGDGSYGYSGDGVAATNASFRHPGGQAFDAFGNLYIADGGNERIRRVDTNSMITTVAGNGNATYAGDNGVATNASLYAPDGVAVDGVGNLFIADFGNHCIRKVSTNGIITTVAGNGNTTYSGDGGAATNASLNGPHAVVLDGIGNLYIADSSDQRIRKVDTNGTITTVAGDGIQSYAGDAGAATNAGLSFPTSVTVDEAGNLYIADAGNQRIRMVDTNGIITTVAGNGIATYAGDNGAATNASLNSPYCVAVDSIGNFYVADENNNRIRKVDTNGIITTVAGTTGSGYSGDGGAGTNANLKWPLDVSFDSIGNLYIADTFNGRIRKLLLYASYPSLTLLNVGAIGAGSYDVVINNSSGSVTSTVATLTIQAPPIITVEPTNQMAVTGSNALFSVAVAGSGPFGFLWYLGGTNLLQNGPNNTLTLSSVSNSNAGNYTVVVTNAYGSITSTVATLTVQPPLVITTSHHHSASQPDCAGRKQPLIFCSSNGFGTIWVGAIWLSVVL